MLQPEQYVERTAAGTASVAAGITGATWILELNSILQLVATVVAIAAGLVAVYYHVLLINKAKKDR